MAIFPENNPGRVPIDGSTPVGAFRNSTGNTIYTLYSPDEPGWGDFAMLSDAEIEQYLAMAEDSNAGAIGYWYMSLAGAAARESASVADYDLKLDLTKRAADLRAMAEYWFGLGGVSTTGGEHFDVVPTGTDSWPYGGVEYFPYSYPLV